MSTALAATRCRALHPGIRPAGRLRVNALVLLLQVLYDYESVSHVNAAKKNGGDTALMRAANGGHAAVVELLRKHGAR